MFEIIKFFTSGFKQPYRSSASNMIITGLISVSVLSISLCSCNKKPTTTDIQNIRTVQLHVKQNNTNVEEDITLPVKEMLSELFKGMDVKVVSKHELGDAVLSIKLKGRPRKASFTKPKRTFYEAAVVNGTARLAIKGFSSKKATLYGAKHYHSTIYYPYSNSDPKEPLLFASKRAFVKMFIDLWGPPALLSIFQSSYSYTIRPDFKNPLEEIIKKKDWPSFVPVIFQALQNDNSSVRLAAVNVLEEFTVTKTYYDGSDREIIKMSSNMKKIVLKYLSQFIKVVKDEVEKSVGYKRSKMGPIPDWILIIEKGMRILSEFGQDANMAIPVIKEALKSGHYQIKSAALGTIGDIARPQESVPILIDGLESKEQDNRRVALIALEGIGSDAKEALPYIIHMVEHEKTYLRCNAADALVKIGPEKRAAVPALIKALKSAEEDDKRCFAEALEQISDQKFGYSVKKWQEWWETQKKSKKSIKSSYRDRDTPHRAPLPHHAAYGSVLRGSADQAESDPGLRGSADQAESDPGEHKPM